MYKYIDDLVDTLAILKEKPSDERMGPIHRIQAEDYGRGGILEELDELFPPSEWEDEIAVDNKERARDINKTFNR